MVFVDIVVVVVVHSNELEDQPFTEHEFLVFLDHVGQEKRALTNKVSLFVSLESVAVLVVDRQGRAEEKDFSLNEVNWQVFVGDTSKAVHCAAYLALESNFADAGGRDVGKHSVGVGGGLGKERKKSRAGHWNSLDSPANLLVSQLRASREGPLPAFPLGAITSRGCFHRLLLPTVYKNRTTVQHATLAFK